MHTYDITIIGAGIHGAGFSFIASALGLRCLLIEKSAAVGSATSSNSSKLIHGGLRYLESGQFKLVAECLRERTRLLRAAPDLVQLKPFYIPVFSHSARTGLTIGLGLGLYQLLGGGNFTKIPRQAWPQFPITQNTLTSLWRYWDCQTQDQLLTQRVTQAAEQFGCQLMLNTSALSIEMHKNQGQNNFVLQLNNGDTVQSRCLINAAGPWVNQVAALNNQLPKLPIKWVQGSHIVIDRTALDGCFYLESPVDKRPFFVLPWQGQQLIGTTETVIMDPSAAHIQAAEIHYLLASYNHYFNEHAACTTDIVQTFCGVRVLPFCAGNASGINRAKRDTHILTSAQIPGYLALYGGKLTSFYATALKGLQQLAPLFTHSASGALRSFGDFIIQQPKF